MIKRIFFDKKGEETNFLATKVVKILIALVCVVFLIYLITQVWYSANKDTNYKKAEASIETVYLEIVRINEGGLENSEGTLVPNPSGWDIIGFTENEKPNSCVGEKCICVCDINFLDNIKSSAQKCDENGICKNVENLVSFDTIKIPTAGIFLSIKKTENGVEIGELNDWLR